MSDRLNVRSLRVRKVHSLRTFLWLARGWKDFTSTPWVGVSHGLLMGLFGYGFGDHVLGQGGGGLQRGGNGLGTRDGDDRHGGLFHLNLSSIRLSGCGQLHFGLRFIITLATGIFVDALATLAFDPLTARSTARAALTFGLLLLLTDHGRSLGQIRSLLVYRQDRGVGGGDIDPNLLAQLATFAALGHFLLFFLTRLGADGGSLDGFYRFNHDLGTGLARSTGFASRARGAGFTFLTGLTGFAIRTRLVACFAGLTFHALFAAHFTTGFTLLTGLALFTRTTVAALATLAVGGAFTLLASVGRVAVAAVVIATTTLATAAGFVTLMTVTLILARFPLCGRLLGSSFRFSRSCV